VLFHEFGQVRRGQTRFEISECALVAGFRRRVDNRLHGASIDRRRQTDTPDACSDATSKDRPGIPTMKLNILESALKTVFTASRSVSPGAIRTFAPASSYAFNRRIVSSRSVFPREKFSHRLVR